MQLRPLPESSGESSLRFSLAPIERKSHPAKRRRWLPKHRQEPDRPLPSPQQAEPRTKPRHPDAVRDSGTGRSFSVHPERKPHPREQSSLPPLQPKARARSMLPPMRVYPENGGTMPPWSIQPESRSPQALTRNNRALRIQLTRLRISPASFGPAVFCAASLCFHTNPTV